MNEVAFKGDKIEHSGLKSSRKMIEQEWFSWDGKQKGSIVTT